MNTDDNLYALLIGISKDVGEIKSDVKNVQQNVENYNNESMRADEKVSNKLEEYFQYAKNRQDGIKAELETKIGNVRVDVTNLSDKVKGQAQPDVFEGAFTQIEAQMGKYQGHESWNIQEIQGMKAYTTLVNFEKSQLGMVIVYDEDGKMLGINMVPAQAIKPDN